MAATERSYATAQMAAAMFLTAVAADAAVLPEDRADALYHIYDGGGVEISGPSILVRKSIGERLSISGNYYVDAVSSASIDVVTSASPYTEERTEKSVAADYLQGKTLMSLGYTQSDESDYTAETVGFSISREIFGDLTTVTLGYALASDEVRNNSDASFRESVDRQNFRLGVTQILSKESLFALNWETITDEGYLNNPYRSVRYLSGSGYLTEPEVYPNTRTSNALALKLRYYLPYRAALSGEYRYFSDTWGIEAHNAEIAYTHPFAGDWVFDLKYRFYTQTAADFYRDLFAREGELNFRARDKELSSFRSHSLGLGASYAFAKQGWAFIDRGSLNLHYDLIRFDYDNFRDLRSSAAPGDEPLYGFSANVWKVFLSIWY